MYQITLDYRRVRQLKAWPDKSVQRLQSCRPRQFSARAARRASFSFIFGLENGLVNSLYHSCSLATYNNQQHPQILYIAEQNWYRLFARQTPAVFPYRRNKRSGSERRQRYDKAVTSRSAAVADSTIKPRSMQLQFSLPRDIIIIKAAIQLARYLYVYNHRL